MIAVITGDLVGSTKMSPGDYQRAIGLCTQMIDYFAEHFCATGEIYRGDSLQLCFDQPQHSMKCAVLLKMFLLQAKLTTGSIGVTLAVGLGDAKVTGATPGVSQGTAFTHSGRGLDKATSGELSLHMDNTPLQEKLIIASKFLNHLLASLTQVQGRVLYHYLLMNYPTHQKLADHLKSSQQNVTKHLSRIGASLVEEYLGFFEQQIIKANV